MEEGGSVCFPCSCSVFLCFLVREYLGIFSYILHFFVNNNNSVIGYNISCVFFFVWLAFIFWFDMFYQVDIGRVWGIGFEGSSILNGLVIYLERGLKEDEK